MKTLDEKDENKSRRRKFVRTFSIIIASISVVLTIAFLFLLISGYPGSTVMFCISAILTFLLVVYLVLWNLCYHNRYARTAATLRECYLIFLAVCVAGFVVLQVLITSGSRYDAENAGVIIVLGAGIYGETPSSVLASRLDAAIEYAAMHEDVVVIVSGGQGQGEAISEAEAMRRYLARRGVRESNILMEEKSTSTRENIAYSLALMEDAGLDPDNTKIAVVTNEFHLFRAKRIAGKLGIDAEGIPAKTPYLTTRVIYQCREAAAVLFDFLGIGI